MKTKTKQSTLTHTDTLVISAAVALVRTLELDDSELTESDANVAVGAVEDWIYDMGQEYVTDSRDIIVGQVCREMSIELEEVRP